MTISDLNDLLRDISDTITKLDELKRQSKEVREALAIQAKQEALVKRLCEEWKERTPQVVPMPYPVYPYPANPWPGPPWIYTHTTTGTSGKLPEPPPVVSIL